jgi:hypothetical protein
MSDASEIPEHPAEPKPRRFQEYEDPHYHDDEEVVPADDIISRSPRNPPRRKPIRRPPPRRPHYED